MNAALLLTVLVCGADPAPAQPQPGQPARVSIFIDFRWILTVFPDGHVDMQYGSTAGDSEELPAGTVDFAALLKAVRRLEVPDTDQQRTKAAIHLAGQNSTQAVGLKDDTLVRYLVDSFAGKWPTGNKRFHELLAKYPPYPAE